MHGNRENGSLNEVTGAIDQKASIRTIGLVRRFFLVACLLLVYGKLSSQVLRKLYRTRPWFLRSTMLLPATIPSWRLY